MHGGVDNRTLDLQQVEACRQAVDGAGEVYNLAADMGGMGFIENNKALCMLSVLINTNLLLAGREADVNRYFFASSACVYAADKQVSTDVTALREQDAYPAMPEDGYGWEKLFSERMCRHFREDFGFTTRVARYHNVYGEHGTFDGGREKAPAAICRKVVQAKLSGHHDIEVWGMASRPAASCTSPTASTAPPRSWTATSPSRSTSAAPSWSPSTSWWTSWRRSPGSR